MLWFTSDQHFGHRNIIQYCDRPFSDVDHMTEELVRRFNEKVKAGDEVIHVGDFSMHERFVLQVLPRLSGHHSLVSGNHDTCHPCRKGWKKAVQNYKLWGFESVAVELVVEGFLVCHMPYSSDARHDEKYAEFRPKDEGKWLLHGHVHQLWDRRDRMINVGVDVWDYAPVSIEELKAIRAA